jgi:hypothetical protein
MSQASTRPLFSEVYFREQRQRFLQQQRENARIVETHLERIIEPIRAVSYAAKMELRTSPELASIHYDHSLQAITAGIAAEEIQRLIALCIEGTANESQQRVIAGLRENPKQLREVLISAYQAPAVERFWRHHANTHRHAYVPEPGKMGREMLARLVREHFETIPGITDLRGGARSV